MSAEQIRKHFVQLLGADVRVTFDDPANPRKVVLHRHDRLTDTFVTWAFEQLAKAAPDVASTIDRLVISYEGRLGPAQQGVTIPLSMRMPSPLASPTSRSGRS